MPGPPGQVVYPAFLSRSRQSFLLGLYNLTSSIPKDGLYHDSFTGKWRSCKDHSYPMTVTWHFSWVDPDITSSVTNLRQTGRVIPFMKCMKFSPPSTPELTLYPDYNSNNNSKHGSFAVRKPFATTDFPSATYPTKCLTAATSFSHRLTEWVPLPSTPAMIPADANSASYTNESTTAATGVNGVFTILTDCYRQRTETNYVTVSHVHTRRSGTTGKTSYETTGRILFRAVSRLSLHDHEEQKTLCTKPFLNLCWMDLTNMRRCAKNSSTNLLHRERLR